MFPEQSTAEPRPDESAEAPRSGQKAD
jgi:hypothetical protein